MEQRVSYAIKVITILIFLLLTGYYSQHIYRTLPSQMGFSVKWNTQKNQLVIASVYPSLQDSLQVGDVITAINDTATTRRNVLPTPKTAQYELQLLRDSQPIAVTMTPVDGRSRIFTDLYGAVTMLSIGAAILLVGKRKSDIAPAVVFMLTAVGWLAIPSFQFGEPTAWMIGYVMVPIMGPLYAQLGYAVRSESNERIMPRWLTVWLVLAVIWGVLGGFEYLYLFPQGSSLHALFPVDWLAMSYLSVGMGLLLAVIIILVRAGKLPPSYTKRQLVILILFVSVGTLPFVFLTVLPRVFTGSERLPGTVGFALLLLLPIGFLFVILRRQHLYMEMATSRILTGVLLTVTCIIVFSVVRLNLIHKGLHIPRETSLLVIAVGLLGAYPNSMLLDGMKVILYGKARLTQHEMQTMARRMTREPRWKTVETALESVAQALALENLILYEWNEPAYRSVASAYPVSADNTLPATINSTTLFPKGMTRTADIVALEGLFSDKSIYIPIITANFLTGFLIAAAGSTLEQLNERDLVQLRQLGDTIAMGLPAINLFETLNSGQALSVYHREMERQRLAAEIHDGPLQELLLLGRRIEERQDINAVAQKLREICQRLFNPILNEEPQYIAKYVVRSFRLAPFTIHLTIQKSATEVIVAPKAKLAFYHILKESLSNIAKHTQAENVFVELVAQGTQFKMTVIDDGGVATEPVMHEQPAEGHLGLFNMQNWALIADGEIVIDKSFPSGWRVYLTLPTTHTTVEEQENATDEMIDETVE